jgi:hypothetical protein
VSSIIQYAIQDNRSRGKVGDFLKTCLKDGATLSFVSAFFTICAYEKLKDQQHKIDHLNFLFCEPLSSRDGKLVSKSKQIDGAEDFELITWLVIKG